MYQFVDRNLHIGGVVWDHLGCGGLELGQDAYAR